MKSNARDQHREKLEVVKIKSDEMTRRMRKKKYLNLVRAIREMPGQRSGRMGALQNRHLDKKKKMLQKYLDKVEREQQQAPRAHFLPPINTGRGRSRQPERRVTNHTPKPKRFSSMQKAIKAEKSRYRNYDNKISRKLEDRMSLSQ